MNSFYLLWFLIGVLAILTVIVAIVSGKKDK
ncbi:MAG: hypothetical protein ACD_12C00137G0004 [uncultured bacterium]|nr:MAG: hypothetical protein ACD_12C00137G0004 [uncultured bacterium]